MTDEILNSFKKNIMWKEFREFSDIKYISGVFNMDDINLCGETNKYKNKIIIFNDYYGEGDGINEGNSDLRERLYVWKN